MDDSLTARQTQILKAVIDEYIETANPVGSESLEKKYNLGVSPATIRNEMAYLIKKGYLKQTHTSSGRSPTPKGMKFYIDQLMEEKELSVTDEVKAKEKIWDAREDLDNLFERATKALSAHTNSLAIGTVAEHNKIWHSGYSKVFANPEFSDLLVCESLFALLEEMDRLKNLLFEQEFSDPVDVLFGEELGWQNLEPVSIVASRFKVDNKKAAFAVVGPTRIQYYTVIPTIRYFTNLVQEIAQS